MCVCVFVCVCVCVFVCVCSKSIARGRHTTGHDRTAESIREKWRKMVLKDPALNALGPDTVTGAGDSDKTPTLAHAKEVAGRRGDGGGQSEQADGEGDGGEGQDEEEEEVAAGGLVIDDDTDEEDEDDGEGRGDDMPQGTGEEAGPVDAGA